MHPSREVQAALRNIILAADIKHALSVRQYAIKQRRKAPQRMRTEQQIDLRIALFDLFNILFLLRHAAAQRDDDIRPLLLEMAQRADVAEGTILRMLSHCTGVEQDEIRLFRAVCHFISHFMQHAANALGIRFFCWRQRYAYRLWGIWPPSGGRQRQS